MKTESVLEKVIASGKLAVTSECGPPRGAVPETIIEKSQDASRICGCGQCYG